MRVALTVQRPPHVHFFREAIDELARDGHDVFVFVRDSEITTALLDAYGIEHTVLTDDPNGSFPSLAFKQATFEVKLIRHLRRIDPHVVGGVGGLSASHAAAAVGARGVAFTDTEHARLSNVLMRPFVDEVYTPDCFHANFGDGHVRYPGYHELAYLHPDRFTPDPSVFDETDLDPDRPLAILRFAGWEAAHDFGANGIDDPMTVIDRLEEAGAQVRLTSEAPLGADAERYELDLPPDRFHHLLAHASLYLGEGATTAAESAVLGTPAVYVNSLRMGYTDELEARYGLLVNCQGSFRRERAIRTAERILDGRDETDVDRRRAAMLGEKVDTTAIVVDAITNGGEIG